MSGADTSLSGVAAGAAIAAYSFLGFDAVSTLTEESVDPQRTIPRAIMWTVVIGGGIFLVVSYAAQLVHPGGHFAHPGSAAFGIAKTIGGDLFSSFFLAGLIVTQFASGIAAQASVSRLLYAMGRDTVLPRRVFARLSKRFHTPVFNILLCGAVGLGAIALSVETSTSFIDFGAFIAFTSVNICVIALYLRTGRQRPVTGYLIAPAIGAAVDIWLLTQLDRNALVVGGIWLACGVLYLTWLTRGFRRPPPEADLDDTGAFAAQGAPAA